MIPEMPGNWRTVGGSTWGSSFVESLCVLFSG